MKRSFFQYVSLNVLGALGLSGYILADTLFVAHRLGTDGLAALNLAISVFGLINGLGLMLGIGGATAHAACTTATDTNASAIITVTKSGATPRLISRFRPETPIIACVMDEPVQRQLSLTWGVRPLIMPYVQSTDEMIEGSVAVAQAAGLRKTYEAMMDGLAPHKALEEVFKLIQRANKYIDENAPWALAKDMETNGKRLAHVLYNLLEATRICGILLTPFMPESCEKLFAQIGAPAESRTWDAAAEWGALPETAAVTKGENLFPRLDMDKALEELEAAEAAAKKAALPAVEVEPQLTEKVDFDTFCKSDFRAVKVKACDAVKKSEKLLRFTLDDGTGVDRQILSGIHKWYEPEDLVGKTLIAIVNLPPRKMMGLESNGMLISAVHTEHGEECLHLIMVDDSIPAGAKLC